MQCNEFKRMSKLSQMLQISACVVLAMYGIAGRSESTIAYTQHLRNIASSIYVVSMYYTPYTDATFESNDEMKKSALYKIQINCFLNCDMYMKNIVDQFEGAKKIACPSMMGSRYLLIELQGKGLDIYINYLKWGNVIVYNDECFYNKKSIDTVVPSYHIFDGMLGNDAAKPKQGPG